MRERIIRVLLTEPDGSLTKYQLAKKAECSYPWAHELLGKLEAMKLVKGTKVENYTALIKYWFKIRVKPRKREYMHRDPINLIKKQNCPTPLQPIKQKTLFNNISSPPAPTFT
jgi:hypothetical protein